MTIQNICKGKSFSNRIGSLLHFTHEKMHIHPHPKQYTKSILDDCCSTCERLRFLQQDTKSSVYCFLELFMDFILFS